MQFDDQVERLVSGSFVVSLGASAALLGGSETPSLLGLSADDLAWGDFCIGVACLNFAMFVLAPRVRDERELLELVYRELKARRGDIALQALLTVGPYVFTGLKAVKSSDLAAAERPLAVGDVHGMWVLHEVLKRQPLQEEASVARLLGQFIMHAGAGLT